MKIDRPKERIDKKALPAWRLRGAIYAFFEILVVVAYFIVRHVAFDLPVLPGIILGILVGGIIVMQIFIIPAVRMVYWGYEIRESEIDIQHGIIVIKRVLIPMVRIQHVDTEHGPILRKFGLATLSISTAGTNHKIPALKMETAKTLRAQIAYLASVSDEDV